MSNVTDVVFVASYRDADRFAQLVSEHYWNGKHTPKPLEDGGPKASGAQVFNFGFNYATEELLTALRDEKWTGHTMLWIRSEHCDGPEVWVDGKRILEAKFDTW